MRLVFLLAGLTVAGCAGSSHASRELDAARERIRTSGFPTAVNELRSPAVPDADNAALVLARVTAVLESRAYRGEPDAQNGIADRLWNIRARHPKHTFDAASAADLRALLAEPIVTEILSLASEAATKSGYDANLDYTHGLEKVSPPIGPLRATTDLLRARSWLAAHDGDVPAACADAWTIFALGDFHGSEPTLLSQLGRCALHGIALAALQDIAQAHPLPPLWVQRLQTRFLQTDLKSSMLRSLDGERLLGGRDIFERALGRDTRALAGLAHAVELESGRKLPALSPALIELEYTEYLDRMREFRVATAELWPDPIAQAQRLRAISASIPRQRILVGIVLPTLTTVVDKAQFYQAKLTVTAAALALQRHWTEHAAIPEALAALDPAFPRERTRDPFSGQPLLLRRHENTVTVYSIGKNQRDVAGVFAPDEDKDDPAFTVLLRSP